MKISFQLKTPPREINNNVEKYVRQLLDAVQRIAFLYSAGLEAYAKDNAPWTDRSGRARAELYSDVQVGEWFVEIYLSHGPNVDYGVYLELAHAGKDAIIMPALEASFLEILRMLQGIKL